MPRLFDTSWVGFDASNYRTARYTYAGVAADFDNDGDIDVATVSAWNIPGMAVLLNAGGGVLEQPDIYPLSAASEEVIAADFDGDGFTDIVASVTGSFAGGTTIALYHNNGDGTFALPQEFSAGSGPVGLAAADFDRDGDLDLAVANSGFGSNSVSVLYNHGGTFAPPASFPAGTAPYRVVAADFDDDGWQDLAVANGQFNTQFSQINVLFNDGVGGFSAPVSFAPPGGVPVFFPTVAAGDIDRDGDKDILFSETMLRGILVLENLGSRQFGSMRTMPTDPNSGGVTAIAVGDVTGDGWPDLFGPHLDTQGWTILPSSGGGTFGPAMWYSSGEAPIDVEVADADEDGDLDIIVISRDSLEVAIHLNQQGSFAPQPRYQVEWLAAWIDAGDIDSDGDCDLVAASANFDILRNNGDGTFSVEHMAAPGTNPGDTRLRDLDGDKDLDLLWTEDAPPYSYGFALNDGTGRFGPITTGGNLGSCGNFKAGIDTADFDGDGDLDFVFVENLGCPGGGGPRLFVVENLGGATFQLVNIVPINGGARSLVPGDFNEDGLVDLALTGRPTSVLLGHGDFTFTRVDASDLPGIYIDTADFDGDGHLDLAVAIQRNVAPWIESMAIMLGRGDGTFGPAHVYLGSHSPNLAQIQAITTGDVDGDGDLDVIASNTASNDASIWLNDGAGYFRPQVRYGINPRPSDLLYEDVTGDGVGDLVAVGGSMGVSTSGVTVVPGLLSPALPGDLDGDGDVDLADLGIVLSDYGCTGGNCPGDADGDGDTDLADLGIVLANFGR